MEHSTNTYPYGLVNMASKYTARIPHLFTDPVERDHVSDLCLIDLPELDHPVPTVNVVEIRQIGEDSLSTILEESTRSTEAHGTSYTRTLIDPYGQEFWLFHPALEAPSSPLAMMSPLMMGRPIKRGSLRRKETTTVGIGEST
jgi:hypothetical protein